MMESLVHPNAGQAGQHKKLAASIILVGLIFSLSGCSLLQTLPGPTVPTTPGDQTPPDEPQTPPPPVPGRAHMVVNPAQKTKRVNPLVFGININRWVPTLFPGRYETRDATANWPAIHRVKDSGVRILKFPGGLEADSYIWNNPYNPASDTDTDEMVFLARYVGAEPWIQVNTLAGAALAAEWVRYTNVVKGYNVKYWEIGDEEYGTWAKGHTTPEEYGKRVIEYARAMKAVDPSITIVASGVANSGFGDWTRRLLKTAAGSIDALTFSFFPMEPGTETDERLLATPAELEQGVYWLRDTIALIVPQHAGRIQIFVGGWNSLSWDPGPQSLQMVSAVWVADMLGRMLNLPLDGAAYWALQNGGGTRGGDFGYLSPKTDATPRFTYWAFYLYAQHFGTQLVMATSDDSRIRVYAGTDGAPNPTISLIAVNTNRYSAVPIEIRLASGTPGTVRAYLLDEQHLATPVDDATATNLTMPPYSVMAITVAPN